MDPGKFETIACRKSFVLTQIMVWVYNKLYMYIDWTQQADTLEQRWVNIWTIWATSAA